VKLRMTTGIKLRCLVGLKSLGFLIVTACSTAEHDQGTIETRGDLAHLSETVTDSVLKLICQPPIEVEQPQLSIAMPLERFAGNYVLTVVATSALEADTIAHGTLWLRPTDAEYKHAPNPEILTPLYGASDIDLRSLGPVSLKYSPASWNQDRPGVLVSYDSVDRTLWLEFGAAERDVFITDSGAFFDVFSIDSLGFSGRWVDGGITDPLPEGYFCARRLPVVE
jgi:hypothetical protein